MRRRDQTIPAGYFEQMYLANTDPWQFATSAYEQEKYAATLALLQKRLYQRALEVGCSIGIFTDRLAAHCGNLLAIDASEIALDRARAHCRRNAVRFEQRMVPADFPTGRFNLIVLSEVLYFLAPNDLAKLARRCMDALEPSGEMILCHWLGETDYPLSGKAASDLFAAAFVKRFRRRLIACDQVYRLERISA